MDYLKELFVKQRFQFREKREFVDQFDEKIIFDMKEQNTIGDLRLLRQINESSVSECNKYHDMFVKFVDFYINASKPCEINKDRKLFVRTSHLHKPYTSQCVIVICDGRLLQNHNFNHQFIKN